MWNVATQFLLSYPRYHSSKTEKSNGEEDSFINAKGLSEIQAILKGDARINLVDVDVFVRKICLLQLEDQQTPSPVSANQQNEEGLCRRFTLLLSFQCEVGAHVFTFTLCT